MDLDEYLWRNKIKLIDFAELTNITVNNLGLIKRKKTVPRLDTALIIQAASGNQISLFELLCDKKFDRVKKTLAKIRESEDSE